MDISNVWSKKDCDTIKTLYEELLKCEEEQRIAKLKTDDARILLLEYMKSDSTLGPKRVGEICLSTDTGFVIISFDIYDKLRIRTFEADDKRY